MGQCAYSAVIVPPVMDGDVMCSSTHIRSLLARGETEHAQRLLRIEEAQGAVPSGTL